MRRGVSQAVCHDETIQHGRYRHCVHEGRVHLMEPDENDQINKHALNRLTTTPAPAFRTKCSSQ